MLSCLSRDRHLLNKRWLSLLPRISKTFNHDGHKGHEGNLKVSYLKDAYYFADQVRLLCVRRYAYPFLKGAKDAKLLRFSLRLCGFALDCLHRTQSFTDFERAIAEKRNLFAPNADACVTTGIIRLTCQECVL